MIMYIRLSGLSSAGFCLVIITFTLKAMNNFFSVGSLGRGGSNVSVERIQVSYVNFFNTTNGARIKTWQVNFYILNPSLFHVS